MHVCVVIPYYQRRAGILSRALRSVFAQRLAHDVCIIVVDDSSPISAAEEIKGLSVPPRFSLELVTQQNGGPGAARNRGLEIARASADYVAFLDSDDVWASNHLEHAMAALGAGFDFYFSDHFQLGQSVGAFRRAARLDARAHPGINTASCLHQFCGDMFDQIVAGNVIGTSTVVYDFVRFPGLRFREDFRNGGEDYLFWLEFARLGARFAFSSECEVTYGDGVNVYAGSGWGTQGHLLRVHDEMKYRKHLLATYALNPEVRAIVVHHVCALREAFVRDVLRRLFHRERVPGLLLLAYLRLDPVSVVGFIPLAVRVLTHRGGRRAI